MQPLRVLIDRFVSGEDTTVALANQIEGVLIEEFSDTEMFEELTEVLALYRPGGSPPYVNEDEMARHLRAFAEHWF